VHASQRSAFFQQPRRFRRTESAGSGQDWFRQRRGFQQVVPAHRDERATYEGHIRSGIAGEQFADAVHQQHAGLQAGHCPGRAAHAGDLLRDQPLRNLVETLGSARSQHQQWRRQIARRRCRFKLALRR